MVRVRAAAVAILVGLVGCSGGGGGGGGPVSPISPPPPPPPPPPTGLTMTGPSVGFDRLNAGTAGQRMTVTAASAGDPAISVRIVDPDTPTAASFQQLVLDGDERIQIQFRTPTDQYNTILQGSMMSAGAFSFSDTAPGPILRSLDGVSWGGSDAVFAAYKLQEGAPTGGLPANTGNFTENVTLIEVLQRASNGAAGDGAFFALGQNTPLSAIPTTGTARYSGEAFGRLGTPDVGSTDGFLGALTLDVDFGRSVGAVSGRIDAVLHEADIPMPPDFVITFAADLANGSFVSTSAQTDGLAFDYSGNVIGGFYGPTGPDEVGGVFSFSDPVQGGLTGGFVGGR